MSKTDWITDELEGLKQAGLYNRIRTIASPQGARLVVGDGVRIWSSRSASPLGLSQPCALRAMANGSQLVLGRNVGLSGVD